MNLRRLVVPLLAPALALGLGLGLGSALAPAGAAERPAHRESVGGSPTSVTFTGTGWGHGRGLSQYGARNRAAAGQSYGTILGHYYPGARWGTGSGLIRVRLDADTNRDVVVLPTSRLAVQRVGGRTWRLPQRHHRKIVARWRLLPSGERTLVQLKIRTTWRTWRSFRGDGQFKAPGPVTLVTPHGRTTYRGVLRGTHGDTVNLLSLEQYLRGVVPSEVPAEWPANAVRAQAVAARTYAAFKRAGQRKQRSYYDICDTTACQVYRGVGVEHASSDAAIKATARRVLTSGGAPIFSEFSASNGGYSVAGDFPYLAARYDSYDHGAPGDPWKVKVAASKITRNWAGMGDLVSITVVDRDGNSTHPGHVRTLRVEGTNFTRTLDTATEVENFRSWLGLRSTMFDLS